MSCASGDAHCMATSSRYEMLGRACVGLNERTNLSMAESASLMAERLQRRGTPPPVHRFSDRCALFLGFDGTLMNLERRPDRVVVDGGLLYLLDELYVATAGATAIISARSVADLDTLLLPLRLPVAGVHGAQRRRADGSIEKCVIPATLLWQTRMSLRLRLRRYEGLCIEDRGCAFAIHYRNAVSVPLPRLRADLEVLASASRGYFEVLEGAERFELRPCARDKGRALESFMAEPPFAGRLPIFIGDDQTDRSAFEAVARLNGIGIAVGSHVAAPWWLPDPAAVRAWLRSCMGLTC
jgi:trehalose 6-phosphate phosphatase